MLFAQLIGRADAPSYRDRGTKGATRQVQNNLDGHSVRDLRTEFEQKQRSISGHCDEE